MTKSEYQEYLASDHWQQRREVFLANHEFCNRCDMSREEAKRAYGQDMNVHHQSYRNLGAEPDEDIEALCWRCHDNETFGRPDAFRPDLHGSALIRYLKAWADAQNPCPTTLMTEYGLAGVFG